MYGINGYIYATHVYVYARERKKCRHKIGYENKRSINLYAYQFCFIIHVYVDFYKLNLANSIIL